MAMSRASPATDLGFLLHKHPATGCTRPSSSSDAAAELLTHLDVLIRVRDEDDKHDWVDGAAIAKLLKRGEVGALHWCSITALPRLGLAI